MNLDDIRKPKNYNDYINLYSQQHTAKSERLIKQEGFT